MSAPEWRRKGYADPHANFDTCPGFESWWDGMPLDHWYCKHCGGVLQKHKAPLIEEIDEEQTRRHQSDPA